MVTQAPISFLSFVDKTLTQRGQLKLKILRAYCTFNDQFETQIRKWIHYAINCKVEEISMVFPPMKRPHRFLVDQDFFTSSYFTDLDLTCFRFNPDGAISWEKLLKLRLLHVSLSEDLIENILSGSPLLETLELEGCYGYRRLNITSKSVKTFVFDQYVGTGDVIEINAPTVLSLEINGHLYMRKLLLINVSSLVEADLDYKLCRDFEKISEGAEEEMLKRFILDLRHVKEVKIGRYCLKALSRLEAKGFTFPSNLMVSNDCYNPYESDSDSELLLLDDGAAGDELQERVDATTSSSDEDDEGGDDEDGDDEDGDDEADA